MDGENALALLQRQRCSPLKDKRIYMSSATDPCQPIEARLEMTRAILVELLDYHQPRLVIQTRSPIVLRDLDLLKRFKAVQVNMTVSTDDEQIRRVFEPICPSLKKRLDAITRLHQAGIATSITMAPLLPVKDPKAFAQRLLATGVPKFIIQFFHKSNRQFAARTREEAVCLAKERDWTFAAYQKTLAVLKRYIPNIIEGKPGFAPI